MTQCDDDLVRKAIAGDGLAKLLELYGPSVRQDVVKRIPRRWRALLSDDDVMQQTYVDAFQSIGRFLPQGDGSFARWLDTLARCNLRDAIKMLEAQKRGGGRRRVDLRATDQSVATLLEELAGMGSTPSQHVAKVEAIVDLEGAIRALPLTYRSVVRLYDIECKPIDEVAEALGRSPGAVYMLRSRAHDRLRETLGRTSKYFGPSA